jgi:predicted transcriptional regulator
MESVKISPHEVAVFKTLMAADQWLTAAGIAERAQVAPRTARKHLTKLAELKLVDHVEVFSGYRYRLAGDAADRNRHYYGRLIEAAEVFKGVTSDP